MTAKGDIVSDDPKNPRLNGAGHHEPDDLDESRLERDPNIPWQGNDGLPEPEDFRPSPKKRPGPLAARPGWADFQPAIVGLILMAAMSVAAWQGRIPSGLWVSYKAVFEEGEAWRLVSALFMHADASHLANNCWLFLVFGLVLHAYFGWKTFPFVSLLLGVVTNIGTIMVNQNVRLVGASGMVYAMVALWLVLYSRWDVDRKLPMRIVRAIAFTLVVMFPTTFNPRTSYMAHFLGFVFGLIAGLIIMNSTPPRTRDPLLDPIRPQ